MSSLLWLSELLFNYYKWFDIFRSDYTSSKTFWANLFSKIALSLIVLFNKLYSYNLSLSVSSTSSFLFRLVNILLINEKNWLLRLYTDLSLISLFPDFVRTYNYYNPSAIPKYLLNYLLFLYFWSASSIVFLLPDWYLIESFYCSFIG